VLCIKLSDDCGKININNMSGGYYMIKHVEFPTEFSNVQSVTINGVTFINTLYDEAETITLFIPSLEIQLARLVAPA
jgi:hypothetical protein